jgi:hypothetical protein
LQDRWCEPKPCHAEAIADAAIERAYSIAMNMDLGIFSCKLSSEHREVFDIPDMIRAKNEAIPENKAEYQAEPANQSSRQKSLF